MESRPADGRGEKAPPGVRPPCRRPAPRAVPGLAAGTVPPLTLRKAPSSPALMDGQKGLQGGRPPWAQRSACSPEGEQPGAERLRSGLSLPAVPPSGGRRRPPEGLLHGLWLSASGPAFRFRNRHAPCRPASPGHARDQQQVLGFSSASRSHFSASHSHFSAAALGRGCLPGPAVSFPGAPGSAPPSPSSPPSPSAPLPL